MHARVTAMALPSLESNPIRELLRISTVARLAQTVSRSIAAMRATLEQSKNFACWLRPQSSGLHSFLDDAMALAMTDSDINGVLTFL
jgi:hypothetical protein